MTIYIDNMMSRSVDFHVAGGKIQFQRCYWDKLSFLKLHNLPLPKD